MVVAASAAVEVVGVVGVGLVAAAALPAAWSRQFVARGIVRYSPRSSTLSYLTVRIKR